LNGSFSDLCVRLTGIQGTADTHYGGLVRITGRNAWMGTEKDDTFRSGALANVKTFVESIRTGRHLNNAEQAVGSNLAAIFGRMAGYQQRMVTWEDMMKSTERLQATLMLRW
jgi:myo-inositol 2-dehydrogenase / D-chiro-inositol 1-dehydrogenase